MNFLKIGPFTITDIIFIALFAVVFVFFLLDFRLTSKRSWLVLLGLTALGGAIISQAWRRKRLLEQLAEREEALEKLEGQYDELKKKAQISEAAYQQAKEELDRAKVQAGLAALRADEELAVAAAEIERDYQDMSVEESLRRIREALQSQSRRTG
jgi:cell shape-determining protein MreC